jgi:hypothetical protein
MLDVEAYQLAGDVGDVGLLDFFPLPLYSIDVISITMVVQPHACGSLGVCGVMLSHSFI